MKRILINQYAFEPDPKAVLRFACKDDNIWFSYKKRDESLLKTLSDPWVQRRVVCVIDNGEMTTNHSGGSCVSLDTHNRMCSIGLYRTESEGE